MCLSILQGRYFDRPPLWLEVSAFIGGSKEWAAGGKIGEIRLAVIFELSLARNDADSYLWDLL